MFLIFLVPFSFFFVDFIITAVFQYVNIFFDSFFILFLFAFFYLFRILYSENFGNSTSANDDPSGYAYMSIWQCFIPAAHGYHRHHRPKRKADLPRGSTILRYRYAADLMPIACCGGFCLNGTNMADSH